MNANLGPARPDRPATVRHAPGSVGWLKRHVRDLTGRTVQRVSAPGGRSRRSVRVHLEDGGTLIATRRETPARAETEAALLQALGVAGAPVPRAVAFRDGLLLQEDAGRMRLSTRMAQADPDGRRDLAVAAAGALEACRRAVAARPDLLAAMPGLGTRRGWAEQLTARPVFLSGDLGVAPPAFDVEALTSALTHRPARFTRWEARLGDAAVRSDGTVVWFDWTLFGRRAGVEDLAWLLADDHWRLGLDDSRAAFAAAADLDAAGWALVRRMAVLLMTRRIDAMHRALTAGGWQDADEALRLDGRGALRDPLADIARRGAEIAGSDPMIAGFGPWFAEAASALLDRPAAA